jgi:hypothetical protein
MALPNKRADHERAGNQQRKQHSRCQAGGQDRLPLSVGWSQQYVVPTSVVPFQPLEISRVFRSVKRRIMTPSSWLRHAYCHTVAAA